MIMKNPVKMGSVHKINHMQNTQSWKELLQLNSFCNCLDLGLDILPTDSWIHTKPLCINSLGIDWLGPIATRNYLQKPKEWNKLVS